MSGAALSDPVGTRRSLRTLLARLRVVVCAAILAIGTAAHAAEDPPAPDQPKTDEFRMLHWVESIDKPSAGINDTITLEVFDLEGWIKENSTSSTPRSPWELVPFLNGMPLKDVVPDSISLEPLPVKDATGRLTPVTKVRYRLRRTPASKQAWDDLQDRPTLTLPTEVSLGFPDISRPIYTKVRKEKFNLVIMSLGYLVLGIAIIVVSAASFFWLAATGEIVRDVGAPPRPDGLYPFSLGRSQMAFWFFLVIGSYFFLWVVTGAKDTVTVSVLGLIGISASTALGAAVVDASKRDLDGGVTPVLRLTTNAERRAERDTLQREINLRVAAVATLQAAADAVPPPADLNDILARIRRTKLELQGLQDRLQFFRKRPAARVIDDLLSENGHVSFHRFQIAVWTIVLGIIFVNEVYNFLAMPEFNGTLLGLMGISSATYVGFKLPGDKA